MLVVRPYTAQDRESCLALIDEHIPSAFGVHERDDFAAYLDGVPSPFFVVTEQEASGLVVACGGIEMVAEAAPAEFRWVMVATNWQGQGLGRYLMLRSMASLPAQSADTIVVRTSQHSEGFFRRLGCAATRLRVEPDYWAPGLHLHMLHLHLDGAGKRALKGQVRVWEKKLGLRSLSA